MNAETFCEHFATFADAPNGVEKLRAMILQLAIQGKFGTQDDSDEPASLLFERLQKVGLKGGGASSAKRERRGASNVPIPVSWVWTHLGEAFDVRDGTHDTPKYVDQGVPLVTSKNLSSGTLDFTNIKMISHEDHDAIAVRSAVKRDDILFAMIGSIGNPVVVETDAVFSIKNVALFKPRAAADYCPKFLLYYLRHVSVTMKHEAAGGVQSFVSLGFLRDFPFPMPPLAEQRRIVEKVDQLLGLCDELAARQAAQREKRQRMVGATLDRLVSTRNPAEFPTHAHRLRNHFDQLFDTPTAIPQLRQTILQLAVQGQLAPQDPNDEPIDVVLAEMWEYKLRLIESRTIREPAVQPPVTDEDAPFKLPIGWSWQRWGNICDWITYGFTRPMSHVDFGPPIVTAKNVRDGFISWAETHYAEAAEFAALSPKDRPRNGDLLIVKDGATIGRAAIVEDDKPFCISQTVAVLWLESCQLCREFLLLMIKAPSTQKAIWDAAAGAAMPHLSITDFAKMILPVPPLAEQKRIVTKVTELLSLCDSLEAKLTQAESASTQLLSAAVHQLLERS